MSEIKGLAIQKYHDLKPQDKAVTEAKLREVADMYEKHFIREMMKQMKSTLPEGGLIKKNNAEKIFQDQLDDQYAESWNKRGEFGLSDMIYDQLMNRYGEQFGLKKPVEKSQGPIELSPKHEIEQLPLQNGQKGVTYKIQPSQSDELGSSVVRNPWAGTLLGRNRLETEQMSYRIQHDNGLESLILIQGGPGPKTPALSPGERISAGAELGVSAGTSPLFWTLKKLG